MNYKFAQLGLVLAKRRVAIHWAQPEPPKVKKWMEDLREWAIAEEIRLRLVRTDVNADRDIEMWRTLIEGISEQTGQKSPECSSPDIEDRLNEQE